MRTIPNIGNQSEQLDKIVFNGSYQQLRYEAYTVLTSDWQLVSLPEEFEYSEILFFSSFLFLLLNW